MKPTNGTKPRRTAAEVKIDRHVGARLRAMRQYRAMSQADVASKIGVTYQQLQKYESGRNRIGASRLWRLAIVLGASLDDFFVGLATTGRR